MSTITFTCYACNQVLKVAADKAGKKAKCVKCGTILTIPVSAGEAEAAMPAAPQPQPASRPPAPPPAPARRSDFDFEEPPPPPRRARRDDAYEEPPPRRPRRDDDYEEPPPRRPRREDDSDDAPPRRRPREDDDYDAPRRRPREDYDDDYDRRPGRKWGDWSKVKIGMLLTTISGGILIGYAGLSVISELLFLIGMLAQSETMARASGIIGGIGGIVFFALQLPAVTAYVFCLFAPKKNGALALAIVLLSVGVVSLALKIIWVLLPAIRVFSPRLAIGDLLGVTGTV